MFSDLRGDQVAMAEKIKFSCTCGKSVSAPAEFAGKKAKCPRCGQMLRIPQALDLNQETAPEGNRDFQLPDLSPALPAADSNLLAPLANDPGLPPPLPQTSALSDDLLSEMEPSAGAKCPVCGAAMPVEADACPACGHDLTNSTMLAKLPSLAGGGSSLAQSARQKQLKVARGIMFGVGILTIVVNLVQFGMIDSIVDKQIDAEANKLVMKGMVIDPVKLAEVKSAAKRAVRVAACLLIAEGVVYIIFGFIMTRFPVPITITGLVLYLGTAIVFAVLDPETALQGAIIKVIIVVALVKAVQAAIASQRQQAQGQAAGF